MKAVIFDFDGTLTEKKSKLWIRMLEELGYDVGPDSYYAGLHKKFLDGNITYKKWCELTLKAFQEKGFSKHKLDEMTDSMSLIDGAEDLIKYLHDLGLELHIVSGNIISVINKVLGNIKQLITAINANEFIFDENGKITEIIGTKYDHKGKANYIKELCKRKGYKPSEVLYIGNSRNDEWVYQSGAKTICVNPDGAKSENSIIWNKVIHTNNLMDLKNEING